MISADQAGALAQRWAAECERPTRLCLCCGGQATEAKPCPWCGTSGRNPWDMRAWAERFPNRETLDDAERSELFTWVRSGVRAYCDAVGWESKPSAEDLASWIGLDLGEPFESNAALTVQLLKAAGAAP